MRLEEVDYKCCGIVDRGYSGIVAKSREEK
jgi:hypothetical protein